MKAKRRNTLQLDLKKSGKLRTTCIALEMLSIQWAGHSTKEQREAASFTILTNNRIAVGLIVDLNYTNPSHSPFQEFQQFKKHPKIKQFLESGKRVSYGARAITKGGINSLVKMDFNGGMIIGCDAGTLNPSKIKGSHCALQSGILSCRIYSQNTYRRDM